MVTQILHKKPCKLKKFKEILAAYVFPKFSLLWENPFWQILLWRSIVRNTVTTSATFWRNCTVPLFIYEKSETFEAEFTKLWKSYGLEMFKFSTILWKLLVRQQLRHLWTLYPMLADYIIASNNQNTYKTPFSFSFSSFFLQFLNIFIHFFNYMHEFKLVFVCFVDYTVEILEMCINSEKVKYEWWRGKNPSIDVYGWQKICLLTKSKMK